MFYLFYKTINNYRSIVNVINIYIRHLSRCTSHVNKYVGNNRQLLIRAVEKETRYRK